MLKATALANGDERKAKWTYVRLRAVELSNEAQAEARRVTAQKVSGFIDKASKGKFAYFFYTAIGLVAALATVSAGLELISAFVSPEKAQYLTGDSDFDLGIILMGIPSSLVAYVAMKMQDRCSE